MPDNSTESEKVELNLRWPLEDNLQAVYANQFAISQTGPEVVLAFGAFLPTSFANRTPEEVKEHLKRVTVSVVAKVVLSPEGLNALYGLLKNYVEGQATQSIREAV